MDLKEEFYMDILFADTGAIDKGVPAKNFCRYARKCLYKIRQ